MSEKLCALRKIGGGAMSETELWSNSSPTSSFSGQTVTISSDYNNFKYLKVVYRISTSDSTEGIIIVPKEIFDTTINNQNGNRCYMGGKSSYNYMRPFMRDNANSYTAIYFDNGSKSGVSGAQNGYIIPLKIIGLK